MTVDVPSEGWRPLTDEEWALVRAALPPVDGRSGPRRIDDRAVIDAMLWHDATGRPWRALPAELGRWASVRRRAHWYVVDGRLRPALRVIRGLRQPRSDEPGIDR